MTAMISSPTEDLEAYANEFLAAADLEESDNPAQSPVEPKERSGSLLSILSIDAAKLAWQDEALCAQTDPEAFFPDKGGSTRDAKRVCNTCTVKADCLQYALDNDERFGIWGGLSERERRALRRGRREGMSF